MDTREQILRSAISRLEIDEPKPNDIYRLARAYMDFDVAHEAAIKLAIKTLKRRGDKHS